MYSCHHLEDWQFVVKLDSHCHDNSVPPWWTPKRNDSTHLKDACRKNTRSGLETGEAIKKRPATHKCLFFICTSESHWQGSFCWCASRTLGGSVLIKGHCSQKERTRCVSLFIWNSEWSKQSWVCPVTPSRATGGPRVMHTK